MKINIINIIYIFVDPRHVMLVAPEFIKQMLQDSKVFDNIGLNLKNEVPLVGDSMVVCSGENHHWQRKVLNAAFTPQKLKKYFVFFCSHTDKLIQVRKFDTSFQVKYQ